MTRRLTLEQVVGAAQRAFVGRVESVRSGRDEAGLPCTWVTLSVTEPIFGPVSQTVRFKQIGAAEPLSDGTLFHLAGVPTYHVGDEMVLFLSGESRAGFSSPIALGQGKFHVVHHDGRAWVSASVENAASVRRALRVPPAQQAVEADLDEFLALVHRLAGARR